jgi:GTP-binding protein HflX
MKEFEGREIALLVSVKLPGESVAEVEESLAELERLADSAGARIIAQVIQERRGKDPRSFIGEGKALELKASYGGRINLIIFDGDLSGTQQRNLEDILEVKIIDRTGLILDIFAQRAHTREGMMQVELAQTEYLLSRLVGRHTFLSRLGGGIGTRGPGETKLESDRRRLRKRVSRIRERLEKVRQSRQVMRRNREKRHLPIVSLVGYTNAGKSSLFNALTRANAVVEDRLFATLDPTVRRVSLPGGQIVLLFDTVGFIRKLPHQLIHAFRATLEELLSADLLLHVVDASHPRREEQIRAVDGILGEIGVAHKTTLQVYNKIDRLSSEEKLSFPTNAERVAVSARTGEGIEDLRWRIHSHLTADLHALNGQDHLDNAWNIVLTKRNISSGRKHLPDPKSSKSKAF